MNKRNPDGTFIGSGNPAGRPKGAKDKRNRLREQLELHGDELLKVVLDQAKGGDSSALKLCFERLMPPAKQVAESITFDLTGKTLTEQAQSIVVAISQGELNPDTGRQLIAALSDLSKITEIDELTTRLANLEKHFARVDAAL